VCVCGVCVCVCVYVCHGRYRSKHTPHRWTPRKYGFFLKTLIYKVV
jgi:hypothetical protein